MFYLLICLILSIFLNIFSQQDFTGSYRELLGKDFDFTSIKITGTVKKEKANVTFIEDAKGMKFCIKQLNIDRTRTQFGLVREVLASYIAESVVNIHINKVRIIPANIDFPGKILNGIATLHTFVPGSNKSVDYPIKITLQQRLSKKFSIEERGFNQRVILYMSVHRDLPLIVAFDTFASNPDRTCNNLFYDKKTDIFCGIDLELSFKLPFERDLGILAIYHIKKFMKEKIKFSSKEIASLKKYNNTLKKLLEKNSPEKLCRILDIVASYAGFIPKNKNAYNEELDPANDINLVVHHNRSRAATHIGFLPKDIFSVIRQACLA